MTDMTRREFVKVGAAGAAALAILLLRRPGLISRLTSAMVTATGAWLAFRNLKVTSKLFGGPGA